MSIYNLSIGQHLEYVKLFQGKENVALSEVVHDGDNNIIAVGTSRDTVTNIPDAIISPKAFIVKYDPGGTLIWKIDLPSVTFPQIAVDTLGNVFLATEIGRAGDIAAPNDTIRVEQLGNYSILIAKFGKHGNYEWHQALHRATTLSVYDLKLDESNNLNIVGGIRGSMDFDPGSNNKVVTSVDPDYEDLFCVQYSPLGAFKWVRHYQCRNRVAQSQFSTLLVQDGNLFILGQFNARIKLGGNTTYNGHIDSRMVLFSLDKEGDLRWSMDWKGAAIGSYRRQMVFLDSTSILASLNYLSPNMTRHTTVCISTSGVIKFENEHLNHVNYYATDIYNLSDSIVVNTFLRFSDSEGTTEIRLEKNNVHTNVHTPLLTFNVDGYFGYRVRDLLFISPCEMYVAGVANVAVDINPKGEPQIIEPTYMSNWGFQSIGFLSKYNLNSPKKKVLIESCDSLSLGNQTFYNDTILQEVYLNSCMCDSTIQNVLTVHKSTYIDDTIEVCDSIKIDNHLITKDTIVGRSYTSISGCDSIVNTEIRVQYSYAETMNYEGCDEMIVDGIVCRSDTTFLLNLSSVNGCDSVVHNKVVINKGTRRSESISGCDSLRYHGLYHYRDTTGTLDLVSSAGCDSLVDFALKIYPSTRTMLELSNCDSVQYGMKTYYKSNRDTLLFADKYGCDSTVVVDIEVNNRESSSSVVSYCLFDSIRINGVLLDKDTIVIDSMLTIHGCESLDSTQYVLAETIIEVQDVKLCRGDSVHLQDGSWHSESGTVTFVLDNDSICPRQITTHIDFFEAVPEVHYHETSCIGDSILIGSSVFVSDTTYVQRLQSINGCDSVSVFHLVFNSPYFGSIDTVVCEGDSVYIDNVWVKPNNQLISSYIGSNNCDSTVVYYVMKDEMYLEPQVILDCDSLAVIVQFDLEPGEQILWQDQSRDDRKYFYSAGEIQAMIRSELACWHHFVDTIHTVPTVPKVYLLDTLVIEGSGSLPLDSSVIAHEWWTSIDSYKRNGEVAWEYDMDGEVFFEFMDDAGCTYLDTLYIQLRKQKDHLPEIPNVFRAGRFNKNSWKITDNQSFEFIESKVYDRWGNCVFRGTDVSQYWDGTYSGKPLLEGVYVYVISFRDKLSDNLVLVKGDVFLLR